MASGRLVDYLGSGPAANRPASLSLAPGSLGVWYSTDTKALSVWNGVAWDNEPTWIHKHALSQLEQSGASTGQVPTWNGAAWVPQTPVGGGGGSGAGYATYLAASLEPDALEAVLKGTFTYVVGVSETKLLMASWQTRIGGSGRIEQRNPQRFFPMRNVTLYGTGSGSSALVLDPTTPVYSDPWAKYYSRLQQICELPTRVIPITGASQAVPLLPGAYGAIITQYTCFNLAWLIWRVFGPDGPGLNLWDEESDSAPQRLGNSFLLPVSKRTAGEIESSSASTSTGGSPSGGVCMVLVPSNWGVVADPLGGTYTFRDDFMGSALNTGTWTRAQTTVGNVEIDTTYQWCRLAGNTAWGGNGLYRTAASTRVNGKAMVVDIFMPRGASATGVCLVGWSDGGGHSYTNFAHGLNFAGGTPPGGTLNVYENGNARGTVGSGWTGGCIYRVRITLTSTGATYEIQGGAEYPAIGSASWANITPGTSSSATTNLQPAAAAYANTAYISDVREIG